MKDKNYCIEYMKAFAFLLIFLSHSGMGSITHTDVWWGCAGVSLFLVLSGYLAIYTNKDKSIEKIIHYSFRKIKMVYPLHIFMTICVFPFCIWWIIIGVTDLKQLFLQLLANLTMIQSFIPKESFYFSYNSVSWYLSVFLLCTVLTIPLSKLLANNIKSKGIAWLGLVSIFIIEFVIAFCFGDKEYSHWIIYINPFTRLLDFIAGILVGLIHRYSERVKQFPIWLTFLWLAYCVASCFCNSGIYEYSVIWFPFSVLAIFCFARNEVRYCKSLLFLGDLNLELFLIHQMVLRYFENIYQPKNLIDWLVYTFVCLCISIISAVIWRKLLSLYKNKKSCE